jgi:murein DD-endopeptidase MepM/ murein hydrolase activator NlpD
MYRSRIDELTVVALAFLLFFGFNILRDKGFFSGWFDSPVSQASAASIVAAGNLVTGSNAGLPNQADAAPPGAGPIQGDQAGGGQQLVPLTADTIAAAAQPAIADPTAIIFPYTDYILTQGPHGADYGHMAIDLTAGKGASILSPISGIVTALFIDQYNNTNLIIENERYTVTLFHGNYTVQTGQQVALGDIVGTESNNGYTLDAYGQPCAGRDCGYHTHMNVYDKQIASNVNPLEVLKPAPKKAQ